MFKWQAFMLVFAAIHLEQAFADHVPVFIIIYGCDNILIIFEIRGVCLFSVTLVGMPR